MNENSVLWYFNSLNWDDKFEVDLDKIYSHYQSFMECQDETDNAQKFMAALEASAIQNQPKPPVNNSQSHLASNKNKKSQIDLFNKIIHELVRQNLVFKKKLGEIKQTMQDIIISIQNNLASKVKNFDYFSSLFEEQSVINMTKYIKSTVQKLKLNQKQNQNHSLSIKVLKSENLELHLTIEELNNYIKQRKQYSQKLKQIIKLKQKQIEDIKVSRQNQFKLLQSINQIETSIDLKYRNRNDLITMIKSLITLMIKHDKQCQNLENRTDVQKFQKFLIKSIDLKKRPSLD